MSVRVRAWREFNHQRCIPTGDGFVIANKNDFVMVVVARNPSETAELMKLLDRFLEPESEGG